MLTSKALKILLNDLTVSEIEKELAFKKLGEVIANDVANTHRMTREEHSDINEDYKAMFQVLHRNNEKYLASLSRD